MLHLLPLKFILTLLVIIAGLSVLAGGYAGWIGTGDALNDINLIVRAAPIIVIAVPAFLQLAWRWSPQVQRFVFPYLGGEWSGKLDYRNPDGETGSREISLNIRHNLLNFVITLDAPESKSRTIVAHPERDKNFQLDRIYYVFETIRKEGVKGAGERYRGAAIMRVETGETGCLLADYFTEHKHTGTMKITRETCHPWWKVLN